MTLIFSPQKYGCSRNVLSRTILLWLDISITNNQTKKKLHTDKHRHDVDTCTHWYKVRTVVRPKRSFKSDFAKNMGKTTTRLLN